MKTQISNKIATVKSAANIEAGVEVCLRNGRRLHDREIGRLIENLAAKLGGVFGKESFSYQEHARSRA